MIARAATVHVLDMSFSTVACRRDCEVMASELVKAGIAALAYHAGLEDEKRSMVQQRWVLEDRCKVCCMHLGVHSGFI